LDAFVEAMLKIAEEARTNPVLLKEAPHHSPVRRLDEARAVREPILRFPF
jgi:glycine dehydrogenase (decarboxylating) beta subunit (EC 1.4.4.2)